MLYLVKTEPQGRVTPTQEGPAEGQGLMSGSVWLRQVPLTPQLGQQRC